MTDEQKKSRREIAKIALHEISEHLKIIRDLAKTNYPYIECSMDFQTNCRTPRHIAGDGWVEPVFESRDVTIEIHADI